MPAAMDQCISSSSESPAVAEAKALFAATLASWAQDLLLARQQGLLAMSWQQERFAAEECWSRAA